MSTHLTCEVLPQLDAIEPEKWKCLFPDLPDSLEMIRFIQHCGVPGFTFHNIVVYDDEWPILLLPLFETNYRLSSLVDAKIKHLVETMTRALPFLRSFRLLGVGFVESEWGQVGVDGGIDRPTLEAAWDLALHTLEAFAREVGADLTAFVNFTTQSGRMLPMTKLRGFRQIAGLPFAQIRIVYTHPEQYIASLSKKMRNNLRHKLRKAQGVSVRRTRQPGPWLDLIYHFYVEAYRRSDVSFSRHSRDFFRFVCQRTDDAEYVLYFLGERLVAFGLQVVRADCLIDKYFGMDPVLGREYSLFFVSWFKDIEYCIANQIRLYHAGLTEEKTKARLGAQLVPSLILFQHRQPLVHCLLAGFARYLTYRPTIAMPPVRLGSDWDLSSTERAAA